MPSPMETLTAVRDMSNAARGSNITIGQDKAEKIRSEHVALRGLVARLAGEDADYLSLAKTERLIAELEGRTRMSLQDRMHNTYASLEAALAATTTDDRKRLLGDAAIWILSFGE